MGRALPDDVPLEAKMVTRAIERAQNTVEGRNAETRKNVLKYDEVMNEQRKVIYRRRGQILDGADLRDEALEYLDDAVGAAVATYCVSDITEEWDLEALLTEAKTLWPSQIELAAFEAASSTQELHDMLYDEALALYETRERELGEPVLRQVERQVMLRIIDQRWRQHLREMDLLREGIHLRAMGQKDPATEWQREGFEMFGMMMTGIANDFVKYVMHVQVSSDSASQPEEPAIADMTETKREASAGTSAAQIADANAPKVVEANQQRSKHADRQDRPREGRKKRPVPVRKREEVQELLGQTRLRRRRLS